MAFSMTLLSGVAGFSEVQSMSGTPQVTMILDRIASGDKQAVGQLFPMVYEELRRKAGAYMQRERGNHTLQATALVNEVYVAMIGGEPMTYQNRAHFFHAAALAMRRLLLQHARRRNRREGLLPRIDLENFDPAAQSQADAEVDHEALEAAMLKLEAMDKRRYDVVMLRYFAGLPEQAIADSMGVALKTVQRDWATAKLFLRAEMQASK
jgi:RNA polymerase sigma-70 factor (ECF subfamily)